MREDGLTIAAVGDCYIREPLRLLQQPEQTQAMRQRTGRADLAIANLEMALTRRGAPADKLATLRSDPAVASQLAACGFGIVTLANNHIMDYGPLGLADTLQAVDNAGLRRVGAGLEWEEATRPLTVTLDHTRRVHLLNFACTLGPGAAALPDSPGIAPLRVTQQYQLDPIFAQEQPGTAPWVETFVRPEDQRTILQAIRQVRAQGGWVLVFLHWGIPPHWQAPFQGWLATYQRPLADRLIEAGAHAVIGHHPHVLHGVEIIRGCPVFYSLGNFIFHPRLPVEKPLTPPLSEPGYRIHWQQALAVSGADLRKRESLFLRLRWRGERWEAWLTPLWLDDFGEPQAPNPEQREQILRRLQHMSREVGCELSVVDGEAYLAWDA